MLKFLGKYSGYNDYVNLADFNINLRTLSLEAYPLPDDETSFAYLVLNTDENKLSLMTFSYFKSIVDKLNIKFDWFSNDRLHKTLNNYFANIDLYSRGTNLASDYNIRVTSNVVCKVSENILRILDKLYVFKDCFRIDSIKYLNSKGFVVSVFCGQIYSIDSANGVAQLFSVDLIHNTVEKINDVGVIFSDIKDLSPDTNKLLLNIVLDKVNVDKDFRDILEDYIGVTKLAKLIMFSKK